MSTKAEKWTVWFPATGQFLCSGNGIAVTTDKSDAEMYAAILGGEVVEASELMKAER